MPPALVAIVMGLAVAVATPPAPGDEEAAQQELTQTERAFPLVGRADSIKRLDALLAKWPRTHAAGRALLWLGNLAAEEQRWDDSRARFAEAAARFPDDEIGALGWCGVGDAELSLGHAGAAVDAYQRGIRIGGPPALALELRQKRDLAEGEQRRGIIEIGAWTLLALVAAWFARRLRPVAGAAPLRWFPVEARYLAPLYALVLVASWHQDPAARRAILYFAIGSLALVWLAFLRPLATKARLRLVADALVLTAGNAALLYLAVRRAGLLDVVISTIHGGVEMDR